MDINDLKNIDFDKPDENGIYNNPNLIIRNRRRKVEENRQNRHKENNEPIVAMDPIAAGFKPAEKPAVELNDIQKAYLDVDAMIERKAEEVKAVNELIDSTEGELTKGDIARAQGLSENIIKEMGYDEETIKVEGVNAVEIIDNDDDFETERVGIDFDAINNNSNLIDEIDKAIPDAEPDDDYEDEINEDDEDILQIELHTSQDLEEDIIEKEEDDIISNSNPLQEVSSVSNIINSFNLDESDLRNAIDEIDDEDDDLLKLEDEIEEPELIDEEREDLSTDEQLQVLKNEVIKKIKPIHRALDITGFSVVNKPLSVNTTLNNVSSPTRKSYDWVLMSSERPISMRGYSGEELDALNELNNSENDANAVMDQYKRIYEHITDRNKPGTFKEWAKITSYLDIPHLWFNAYRSTFEGVNFIPYNCTNPKCKNIFLSDDIPMVSMAKFKNDKSKDKFYKIYNTPNVNNNYVYKTDIIPISDNYAVAFKEPSIYNTLFEPNMLSSELTDRYRSLIRLLIYVDTVYMIDYQHQSLRPVAIKEYSKPEDEAKSVNERYKTLIRIFRTLTSDQIGVILTHVKDINNRSDNSLTYVTPACNCPKCGTTIEEAERDPSDLVFTRHKLAALVAL